ncbi:pyridoxal phosphate-dependent aminotransferase [Ignavibacterium sp.]|uniref:pyridoxal phosphate-dependent aminotransferase n=1 Tax=Ignavibacterium sp. TaxID=2651167 RepID=UPI0022047E5F|nr:pyridoxal phosphate-dependent aminotransferase [Ignavibacterium sp.]BDQ03334.1 MAG: aminotransferase [Ignavibacterium sp.]
MSKNNNHRNNFDISLNLNVRGFPISATLWINELSNKLLKEGKKVYKFGLGQSPFPVPQVVVDSLKLNAYQKDYLPVKGLEALRTAVAEFHSRRTGVKRSSDDVLIGPGSKELMFLLQFVYYGDIIIPTPSWVSYAPQAKFIGRNIDWLHTKESNKWKLTPDELEKIFKKDPDKPRLVILNYPSNPTGITYSEKELKEITAIARKYRVILLSDEIYGELHFEGEHISIARFYPEGTIISSGLSKWCGAGGWRLGTFTFPPSLRWLLDTMATVASETYTSTSAPIQYAAITAFRGNISIERYLVNSRRILKALGLYIYKKLSKADILTPKPEGGFYLFINFRKHAAKLKKRGITNSNELAEKLLQDTGVALLPGTHFGRPPEELTLRLAYVDFDGAKALAAIETLPAYKLPDDKFLKNYCFNIIEATDLICNWID